MCPGKSEKTSTQNYGCQLSIHAWARGICRLSNRDMSMNHRCNFVLDSYWKVGFRIKWTRLISPVSRNIGTLLIHVEYETLSNGEHFRTRRNVTDSRVYVSVRYRANIYICGGKLSNELCVNPPERFRSLESVQIKDYGTVHPSVCRWPHVWPISI